MTVADLVRRNGTDPTIRDRPFLVFDDFVLTHAEYYRESCRWAQMLLSRKPAEAPFHLGVLLDNLPEYLLAFGGAALAGATVVGINNTQRGDNLARDIVHSDCAFLVTEPAQLELTEPIRAQLTAISDERLLVVTRWSRGRAGDRRGAMPTTRLEDALGAADDPRIPIAEETPLCLVFTSGTTGAPKAVVISHKRMCSTGEYVGGLMHVGRDDTGYIAMPLFHANSQQCGFMPALMQGARLGMIRRFSRSQWLADVRRYGVTYFNYTGKPLAYILTTPRRHDDRDNPLRVAYGNEGSHRITAEFAERFGCEVIDGFGASEGGFGFSRSVTDPPGSVGRPPDNILILDEKGHECPRARLDEHARIVNPDEAIGEIVNAAGVGKFEGYYKNDEATRERTRGGIYWSGDYGYKDAAGYVYFTGRDLSWLRVDGENFLAKPIEDVIQRHPAVYLCCVYGVPDVDAGDRVMATIVLADDTRFDGEEFLAFLRAQPDVSPKWLPAYVRVARDLPSTATNKPLLRQLRREKFRLDMVADPIYWHNRADEPYRRFLPNDWERLRQTFADRGRAPLLDM